jgi:hypothetical protein
MNFDGSENKLTPEDVENIRLLVNHPAWVNYFVPELERNRNVAIVLLCDPSLARKNNLTDEFLRAEITVLGNLLGLGQDVIDSDDAERQAKLDYKRQDEEYQERAELGQFGPLS